MVRFDTYKAGAFLIWQLRHAGAIIQEDGGDIIHIKLPAGERVSIHLIESDIPLYEIKNTLTYNEALGVHTLFLLWCDMLLPPEGHLIEVHDWEQALLDLYGDRIYAYEVFGQEIFVFPVHFRRDGYYHDISYGETLNLRTMAGVFSELASGSLKGRWSVVGFTQRVGPRHASGEKQHHAASTPPPQRLAAYYELLEVAVDAEPEEIKTAYRRLARKIHPDINQSPDATAQMQALNEAYQRLMEQFDL